MKVALIGANGQLGTDLVASCPKEVILTALTRSDFDVTDPIAMKARLKQVDPDLVINTAAFNRTEDCEDQPELAFGINAFGVRSLALILGEQKKKLLHISTDYVFGGEGRATPYVETDAPNPLSVYGLSKYAGEQFVRTLLPEAHYVVRVASLFGKAGARGKGGNFVMTILKKAREGEPIQVIDDITMSPTYTVDAAKRIWEIIQSAPKAGTYHVTNDGFCTWYEFAKAIIQIAKVDAEVIPVHANTVPSKILRPRWSPLGSLKGTRLAPWKDALKRFLMPG